MIRLFGILMLVLGFQCLLAPLDSAEAVAVMVVILMIIGGIARIAAGLKSGTSGRTWALILGVVMTLGGLALVAQPAIGVLSLTLLLGLYFLADGIVEIAGAFTLKSATHTLCSRPLKSGTRGRESLLLDRGADFHLTIES